MDKFNFQINEKSLWLFTTYGLSFQTYIYMCLVQTHSYIFGHKTQYEPKTRYLQYQWQWTLHNPNWSNTCDRESAITWNWCSHINFHSPRTWYEWSTRVFKASKLVFSWSWASCKRERWGWVVFVGVAIVSQYLKKYIPKQFQIQVLWYAMVVRI